MMNAPNRFGGGTGFYDGKQIEENSIAVILLLFFVFLFALATSFEDHEKPLTDENGCYAKGRLGLYCPPNTEGDRK